MSSPSRNGNYIVELDSLRCLAILPVLAVHFQPPGQPFWRWMSFGWVGVDVFFVISGYLITTILWGMRDNLHPYRTFYWRRILRIFPLYYGYLLLVVAANRSAELWQLLRVCLFLTSIPADSTSLIAARLFHHASFAVSVAPIQDHLFSSPVFGLAMIWSLSIEELFYLFWAPIVLRGSRKLILLCAVLPILICPILRGLGHAPAYPEYFRFLFRIDTLMFGAAVALLLAAIKDGRLKKQVVDRWTKWAIAIPPFVLLPMAWYGLSNDIEIRSTYWFAITGYSIIGLFVAGIVTWCVRHANSPSPVSVLLRNRVSTFIGKISYAMYLFHIYAFVAVFKLARHFKGQEWMPGIGTAWLAALLTIAVASVSWRFIEAPILSLKDRYFPAIRRRQPAEPAFSMHGAEVGETESAAA